MEKMEKMKMKIKYGYKISKIKDIRQYNNYMMIFKIIHGIYIIIIYMIRQSYISTIDLEDKQTYQLNKSSS